MDILTHALDGTDLERSLTALYRTTLPRALNKIASTPVKGDLLAYSFTGQYRGRAPAIQICNAFIKRIAKEVGADTIEAMERTRKLAFDFTEGAGTATVEHFIGGCTANGVDYDVVLVVTMLGDNTFTSATTFTVDFIIEDQH